MALLLRYFSLLLVLLAALAAPAAAYFAGSAYLEREEQAERLAQVQRVKSEEQGLELRLARYEEYAGEAERFLAAAQSAGVTDEAWIRYGVDVQQELLTITELSRLLENARNGFGYYYRPRLLELISTEYGGLTQDQVALLKRERVESGSHIFATVQGDFLVFNRR